MVLTVPKKVYTVNCTMYTYPVTVFLQSIPELFICGIYTPMAGECCSGPRNTFIQFVYIPYLNSREDFCGGHGDRGGGGSLVLHKLVLYLQKNVKANNFSLALQAILIISQFTTLINSMSDSLYLFLTLQDPNLTRCLLHDLFPWGLFSCTTAASTSPELPISCCSEEGAACDSAASDGCADNCIVADSPKRAQVSLECLLRDTVHSQINNIPRWAKCFVM